MDKRAGLHPGSRLLVDWHRRRLVHSRLSNPILRDAGRTNHPHGNGHRNGIAGFAYGDSNNAGLLANIGNIYYDTQLYPTAIEYYQRSLKIQPSNAGVRTDLATAFWYTGSADTAIEEFNKALSYEPNKSNTLFNLGIVKWQGKMDVNGAVAAWQKLLDTNPDYEAKDKVVQLMAQAKKHANVKPGTAEKPLSQ